MHQDAPAVVAILLAADESASDCTVYKLDRTVMLNAQPAGDVAYRGRQLGVGQAFEGQQELMLLRFDARGVGGLFAEVQKGAELKSKARQRGVVDIVGDGHRFLGLYRRTIFWPYGILNLLTSSPAGPFPTNVVSPRTVEARSGGRTC
jgi:hypothetical protein